MCTVCVHAWSLWRAEECVRFLGIVVAGSCELPRGAGPLQERQLLLASELSLQHHPHSVLVLVIRSLVNHIPKPHMGRLLVSPHL